MIEPYYEHNGITIYHGDCREIMPQLGKVDAVVTDPPYGIGYNPVTKSRKKDDIYAGGSWRSNHKKIAGDNNPFDPSFILSLKVPCIIWGINYFNHTLLSNAGRLVWYKAGGIKGYHSSDCELAYISEGKVVHYFAHLWHGFKRATQNGEKVLHPTEKPIALMSWCISLLPDTAQTILDPFMGSGTTLVAAKQLQRKAIGIELEEKYCEIAAKRLAQEVLQFPDTQSPQALSSVDVNLFE